MLIYELYSEPLGIGKHVEQTLCVCVWPDLFKQLAVQHIFDAFSSFLNCLFFPPLWQFQWAKGNMYTFFFYKQCIDSLGELVALCCLWWKLDENVVVAAVVCLEARD